MKKLKVLLTALGILALVYLSALLTLYFRVFTVRSYNVQDWSGFGDFLGGATGSVFGLVSLLALLYTIGLHTTETSRASRERAKANSITGSG